MNRKQVVADLFQAFETGAQGPIAIISPEKYIQHNLATEDGLEGFARLMQHLPPNAINARPLRIFQDGDYVFAHTDYIFFGPKAGFDIFRFENEKIVEHWDNMQETPGVRNPSGHTMFDGATEIQDLAKTEENKKLVAGFVDDILVNGRMNKLASYFHGDDYIQHNPAIPDQLSGLVSALTEMARQGITMQYGKIHMVLGEGNFVLVVSEGTLGGKHTSFYDLFRVAKGKIAEHWDVVEEIPAREHWKNNNGKF